MLLKMDVAIYNNPIVISTKNLDEYRNIAPKNIQILSSFDSDTDFIHKLFDQYDP